MVKSIITMTRNSTNSYLISSFSVLVWSVDRVTDHRLTHTQADAIKNNT